MASVYTLVPRPICEFAGLDLTARCVFGMIWDRWQLSIMPDNQRRFTDAWGVYCLYSRPAMAAELGVSIPTVRRAIDALVKRDLICMRVATKGGAVRYYVTNRALDSMQEAEMPPDLPWLPRWPAGTASGIVAPDGRI